MRTTEWPKVKNIIILVLLLLNGFLLVLVLGRQGAVAQYEQSAVTGAVEVLRQNGIEVAEDALRGIGPLRPMTAARDLTTEQTMVRRLLGEEAEPVDQSGGLYAYATGRGSALFRSNGDFSIEFSERGLDGQEPAVHAAALLKEMGVKGEQLSSSELGESGEVIFCQSLDGAPVYSCLLSFQYGGGRLLSLSGTLMTGAAAPEEDGTTALDIANTLIRFMGGVLDRGDVCSSVTTLRPGYRLSQSFDARFHMTPVWLVSTNVGSYLVDGVTGELEPSDLLLT